MSKLWPLCNKQHPCPICGKDHWSCRFGDRKVLCMRTPSEHASKDGGWYHDYAGAVKFEFKPVHKQLPKPLENIHALMACWIKNTSHDKMRLFAGKLGVSLDSLLDLNCCYASPHQAWAFPMSDGNGAWVGVRLRNEAGDKWAVKGSRQGLFWPSVEPQSIAYLTEGPTDTAAALTIGFYAIGRPSCNSGANELKVALKRNLVRKIVVVGDNDEEKKRPDGTTWNPGMDGARQLAKELKLPHVLWIPPVKDIREFVRLGGTKEMIESTINKKVWER